MQAVIMAGGKGTRLKMITNDIIPKPMALVCGKPILQWQIDCLRKNGVDRILIITGYLGDVITSHFAGQKDISFFSEPEPLGTAGALGLIKEQLEDHFFLVFGDVLFDAALDKMKAFHEENNAAATLLVHPNSHPFDSDLVITDEKSRVLRFDSKHNVRDYWYNNLVNSGIYILSKEICDGIENGVKTDLEKGVLIPACEQGKAVYAYSSPEYVKDVGTPERIQQAEKEILQGIMAARNLSKKQKAVFLDRDGTVNRYNGLIYREDQFQLEECAADAIKLLNKSGYLAVVITNQPAVARGLCEITDIDGIHKKMEALLGNQGAYLDAVYYCPHHPDKGYPEENPRYKVKCRCRKPDIGMLEQAAEKYNIDLSQSWFVGDTTVDLKTGSNAGMRTALVLTGEAGTDRKYPIQPDIEAQNLYCTVTKILETDKGGIV